MSRQLSEENIEIVEEFIRNNKPANYVLQISEWDREQAVSDWITINDSETPTSTYLQFGSDGGGMTSYGYYKAKNNDIYIINAFLNTISCYYKVDSSWYVLNNIENKIE
jgi:hypothetical protein